MNENIKANNNEKMMLIAIAVCLLTGLFGFSFSYYTMETKVVGTLPTIQIDGKTETIQGGGNANSINYGEAITASNLMPGGTPIEKAFSINTYGSSVRYTIKLNITKNTFVKCDSTTKNVAVSEFDPNYNNCKLNAEELVYTLKQGDTVIKQGNLTGVAASEVAFDISPELATTGLKNYTLIIKYLDTSKDPSTNADLCTGTERCTGFDQNHNKNAEFTAGVVISIA